MLRKKEYDRPRTALVGGEYFVILPRLSTLILGFTNWSSCFRRYVIPTQIGLAVAPSRVPFIDLTCPPSIEKLVIQCNGTFQHRFAILFRMLLHLNKLVSLHVCPLSFRWRAPCLPSITPTLGTFKLSWRPPPLWVGKKGDCLWVCGKNTL